MSNSKIGNNHSTEKSRKNKVLWNSQAKVDRKQNSPQTTRKTSKIQVTCHDIIPVKYELAQVESRQTSSEV
jgi:hypothetical protein